MMALASRQPQDDAGLQTEAAYFSPPRYDKIRLACKDLIESRIESCRTILGEMEVILKRELRLRVGRRYCRAIRLSLVLHRGGCSGALVDTDRRSHNAESGASRSKG
jgi:hypothetical protein